MIETWFSKRSIYTINILLYPLVEQCIFDRDYFVWRKKPSDVTVLQLGLGLDLSLGLGLWYILFEVLHLELHWPIAVSSVIVSNPGIVKEFVYVWKCKITWADQGKARAQGSSIPPGSPDDHIVNRWLHIRCWCCLCSSVVWLDWRCVRVGCVCLSVVYSNDVPWVNREKTWWRMLHALADPSCLGSSCKLRWVGMVVMGEMYVVYSKMCFSV